MKIREANALYEIKCSKKDCNYTILGYRLIHELYYLKKEGFEIPHLVCPRCFNRMDIVEDKHFREFLRMDKNE